VSIDDQYDLYERLDRAVTAITPPTAPVDGAIRRGRGIRLRRRAALVAGMVAVAAGVAAVPSLRHAAAEHPAAPYATTVQPPGSHSPPGLIASGTVNGQRWQLVVGRPGAGGAGRGQQIFLASGPAIGPDSVSAANPVIAPDAAHPVLFLEISCGPAAAQSVQVQYGAVRADVAYVKVRLDDGSVLTLHPVKVWGIREVAFAVPAGVQIAGATAYSRHGVIATAVPFNDPGTGTAVFNAWLRPGQPGLSRASGRIASGTAGGSPWSATAYVGPWGICIEAVATGQFPASSCTPATSVMTTSLFFRTEGGPLVVGGPVAPSVTRVVVRPAGGGHATQVRPVTIGAQKFAAFVVPAGKKAAWTAYDSSGHVVASGTT
jgi:hypothetical protein